MTVVNVRVPAHLLGRGSEPNRFLDWEAGREVTLRNLLQRHGYESLEAVRDAGQAEGRAGALRDAIFEVFAARGFDLDASARKAVEDCHDAERLIEWLRRAATVSSAADLLA